MKVVVGSDHAGYELKEKIKQYLKGKNIEIVDVGTNDENSTDYPIYGKKVGKKVLKEKCDFGVVVCGTGIGISIAANKVKGIRAALVYDNLTGRLAKEHNNANIIALGGRTTKEEDAYNILESYMNAKFEERHQKRLDLIEEDE